jgi:hypothetical protein
VSAKAIVLRFEILIITHLRNERGADHSFGSDGIQTSYRIEIRAKSCP